MLAISGVSKYRNTRKRAESSASYLVFVRLEISLAFFDAVGEAESEEDLLSALHEAELELKLHVMSIFLRAWHRSMTEKGAINEPSYDD